MITDLKCIKFILHFKRTPTNTLCFTESEDVGRQLERHFSVFAWTDLIFVYSPATANTEILTCLPSLKLLALILLCEADIYLTADDVLTFVGNNTHSDHFKLLREDGSSLLIGARNIVYNLTMSDLTENTEMRITWNPRSRDKELCLVKGKSGDDCNNYIRVLAKVDSEELLVCGTNAYNPRCRNYSRNNGSVYEVTKEYSGKGYCPYDPRHNSTSIYTGESGLSITFCTSGYQPCFVVKSSNFPT